MFIILNLILFLFCLLLQVFQCLLIDGENVGENALRQAKALTITDKQFEMFCKRHEHLKQFVPESNEKMRNSYLILDEYMRQFVV